MQDPTRRGRLLAVAALAALSAALIPARSGTAETAIRIGTAAPAFSVEDSQGRQQKLAAWTGKTVVLEWTNPECPYVLKHYSRQNMQTLQAEATGRGVVWLTISSSAPGNVGYLDALEANALSDERKAAATAFLLDRDGRLAELYGVTVALTMAVIDPAGTLVYYGAIDDKPTAKPEDIVGARNYVRDALTAVRDGKSPKPAQTRPYGCNAR